MKVKSFFLLILFILFTSEALSISQTDRSVSMRYHAADAQQRPSKKIIRQRIRHEGTVYRPDGHKTRQQSADETIIPENHLTGLPEKLREKTGETIIPENHLAGLPEKLRKKLDPKELRFFPIVKSAADKYDVEMSWIMAIIKTESDFDHKAVSSKGAIGLMQLMPRTASSLGIKNPFEPAKNVHGGTRYFAEMVKTFGRMDLALAAYNAGPTLVKKLRKVPNIRQTRKYVAKVLRYQKKYSAIMPALVSVSFYQKNGSPSTIQPSPLS